MTHLAGQVLHIHYIWVVYQLTALISGILCSDLLSLHVMGNALYKTLSIVYHAK